MKTRKNVKSRRKRSKNVKCNKKTRLDVRKMKGGWSKIITDIYLEIIDLKNCSLKEYDNFINLYIPDIDNLCINKKTQERTQNLIQFIGNRFVEYTLIYLYEESKSIAKHIIAFALIDTSELKTNKVIILELICSHKNSNLYKIHNITLGIYLLDYLYDYYKIYSTEMILKIEPATPELIPYYTKWKTPNISIDNLSITRGYLIYGNIKLITDNTLKYLFNNQLNGIQKIMDYLSITELPKELDTLTMKKSYLKTKALDSEDESIKEQIPDLIDLIKLSSLEEIKDIFIENKQKKRRLEEIKDIFIENKQKKRRLEK